MQRVGWPHGHVRLDYIDFICNWGSGFTAFGGWDVPAAVSHIHVSTCSFNRKAVLSYNCSDVFKIRPMQHKTETITNTENANNLPRRNQAVGTEVAQELCKSCSKTTVCVLCGRLQWAWEWTGREQTGKKKDLQAKERATFATESNK